ERCLGDRHEGLIADQLLLRLANVGAAIEQRGWQTGGEAKDEFLLQQRAASLNRPRIASKQNREAIFGLLAFELELTERRAGAFHQYFGLSEIQFSRIAVADTELDQFEG